MSDPQRAVLRHAEWIIGPERDSGGHIRIPVRETKCETCGHSSGTHHGQEQNDRWALQHAGKTGHRSYLEITTASLAVSPAPTNPLYEQERTR